MALLAPSPRDATKSRPGAAGISRALALSSAVGVGAVFLARVGNLHAVVAVSLAAAGIVAFRRSREAAALALATASFVAIVSFLPSIGRLTPAPLLIALGVLVLAARLRAPWLTRGEVGGTVIAWIVVIAIVSGAALVGWWNLLRPDVSDLTLANELRRGVARPLPLAAAVLGWSALNAVAEEFYFRGALQRALTRALGSAPAVLVQGVAFGLMHYRGFPRGWSGVALATIYGLMLGALRRRSGGLLAPWAAHVVADVIIVVILLSVIR